MSSATPAASVISWRAAGSRSGMVVILLERTARSELIGDR